MLVLNRVVKDYCLHRVMTQELNLAIRRGLKAWGFRSFPLIIHAEFVDLQQGEGGVAADEYFITIPYHVAQDKARSHLKWIVAHELAHVIQIHRGDEPKHDEKFYAILKVLCPRSALHWELAYRPSARHHGIQRKKRRLRRK